MRDVPPLTTLLHRLGRHPLAWLAVFALAWGLPLAGAAGGQSTWDAGVQIVTAQRLIDGRFEPVTLPDLQEGRGVLDLTYRMRVSRPPGSTQSAVYLPGVFAHERITFNGLMVSDRLGTASSGRPRGYERMRLVPVPDAFWLPGENLLDIRIAARELTVMPPVWVGSEASLRERYRAKLMAVAVGPAVVAVIVGCAALVMLLLWWRRPAETLYGYFGAGALLWALHTGWTLLPATVLSGVHHRVWSHAMQTLAVALLTIFVLRFTDSARPGAVRALGWPRPAGQC